ncbi:MAG: HAD family hydrolase [Rhodoglobus sp.]
MVFSSTILDKYGRNVRNHGSADHYREGARAIPTIIFDLDGTLALGDGPLIAFARSVADRVGDTGFVGRARLAIDAFAEGESGYRDGYDAITQTATADGITSETLSAAYGQARIRFGSADAPVLPPDGLAAFLLDIGTRARLVLATNAPDDGVKALLESWGVADVFDAMHFTIGKPDGLVPIVREATQQGPVLAIGDIAEFDLLPAAQCGADTALVGSGATRSTVSVTMRALTLADLYDQITHWIESSSSSAPSSSDNPHPTERHN